MLVEQIDAFKSWLTAVLKPMCEADPAALAKYVLALIKKDKSEAELRKSMIGQLEVFLEGETEGFVNLVFQTLTTKDYITTPVIPSANPPNPNITAKTKEGKEAKVIVQPSELPNLNEVVNGGSADKRTEVRKPDIKNRRNSENGEREERPRRRSRHRSISRNRTKSRSRSWDRVKRSRSREKSRDRGERDQHRLDRDKRDRLDRDRLRTWRNKSPSRRYERRRSRSPRSPTPPRLRSRSRSPRHSHRTRYRSSRSRSRSLEKRERRDSKDLKIHSRPGTPTQDSNHGDDVPISNSNQTLNSVVVQPNNKRRCRDFDEKGYCMKGEMCPFDHGVDPVVLEDSTLTRVLSYNPNGDVAGALGSGPAIAGASVPPGVPTAMRHPGVDNPYNPQAPQMWAGGRFRGPRPMGAVRIPGINTFGQPPSSLGMQRELISVPVVMDSSKPPGVGPPGGYGPLPNASYGHPGAAPPQNYGPGGIPVTHPGLEGATLHPGMYKKKFDFNRLGPRKNPSNCSLELKKVPVGINSITHLNNHFAKFGKIVNIQVQFEGDPEAALITFSSHAEANSAYRSTEAVLNNRFIKLFWHDSDGSKQENMPPVPPKSVKDRLGGNVPPNSNKVLNLVQPKAGETDVDVKTEIKEEKPELSKEDSKAQAAAAIKKNQDLLAVQAKVNKNKDEQRKEVLKIQSDLRKRKQELLDKQLSQQKILIEKMEKLPPGPQRDVLMETIKKTQESIENIKKDLESGALAAKTNSFTKSQKDTQKELLDTELDLIAKQQEGADTTEIQIKLAELNARAKAMARGRGRGRSRYTPIVNRRLLTKNNLLDNKLKGNIKTVNKIVNNVTSSPASLPATASQAVTSFQKHTVDHRPTRLLISGYEMEEQDSVLNHFQQFGEIVDYAIDTSLPSITVNYKTRKDAEIALIKGKHFQDRTLSITWQSGNSHRLQTQRSGDSSTRTVMLSESEEDQLIDQNLLDGDEELLPETEEALLQDDEEEDEEDRSWRR
ncbi:RNA-binding protein 26 [Sitophilus oryzae]|uniref:RNA-binding protein 26 n=1 Tax=Sitophilus oryzae TaxID=7048 RepID=A0A6J2XA33_SITOR|nr:RNA-binding protein 26 [Sitophilus oryzae]